MTVVAQAFGEARASLRGLPVVDPATPPPLALTLAAGPARNGGRPQAEAARADRASPSWSPIGEASAALRAGSASSRSLVEGALACLQGTGELGAIAMLDAERALEEADRLDAEAAGGRWRGPLHGIAVTIKDVIDVAGLPTRAGSVAFERLPGVDAVSVGRLRAAGAVILGKAATHEFALGVTTPQCRNPHDPQRISGGSSGGSAVAVATGVGLGSLGTDTRASLRVPASLCGVVGFKPTYGRVSTVGVVPLGWTVDHVGPIARTVSDAHLLLEVLAGSLKVGPDGIPVLPWGFGAALPGSLAGTVVGVVTSAMEAADASIVACIEERLKALEALGCRLVTSTFPSPRDLSVANDLGLLISRSEAATFHRSAGTDLALCLPEVREQLLLGLEVTASDYLDAQRQRAVLAARALDAFASCDLMASPTTPVTAPRRDDYERFLMRLSENTILWSLVGSPAVSMPAGSDPDGLPVGLQLCAAPDDDALVAQAGIALERA